ncbi:glycine dehydrogenase (aminomethyl-transferring), partial [Aquitalea sp. S1-19]|nr:glycine dehydrogenase (aminomethyl-transferring) [Aquitalea sp. S1-19]
LVYDRFYDTVEVDLGDQAASVYAAALAAGYNLRRVGDSVLAVAFHEQASHEDLAFLITLFTGQAADVAALDAAAADAIPAALKRESAILTHPVFNQYHTEHGLLRYLKRLENRDLAL